MFILGRSVGDELVVRDRQTGEEVLALKVLKVSEGHVQLGFDSSPAHKDRFKIIRKELLDRVVHPHGEG